MYPYVCRIHVSQSPCLKCYFCEVSIPVFFALALKEFASSKVVSSFKIHPHVPAPAIQNCIFPGDKLNHTFSKVDSEYRTSFSFLGGKRLKIYHYNSAPDQVNGTVDYA